MIRRSIMMMPDHLKTRKLCNETVHMEPNLLAYFPDHLTAQEICNEAVRREPYTLWFISDHPKTQGMCNELMRARPAAFFLVPDRFETQEMCINPVEVDPCQLHDMPSLKYVPDWFVTQGKIKLWRDDDGYCNDNRMIEWYKGYQKRKAQKAKIKEELMPNAWHPSRY